MSSAEFGTDENPGGHLRADRLAAGLTRKEFASLLGISRPHLRNLERGGRRITDHVAETAAAVLDTDPARYLPTREG